MNFPNLTVISVAKTVIVLAWLVVIAQAVYGLWAFHGEAALGAYYQWRCKRVAKKLGILSFSFTTKRQIDEFGRWAGHNSEEWREMLHELKRDRSKDVPLTREEMRELF